MIDPHPTKAAEELDKWAAGLEQRAQRYRDLQQQMDATNASAASPDGSVRVTVDSNGVPTDIALSDRTRGAEPTALSGQIMAALHNAQAKLRQQVQALVAATVPADDEPARNLVAQYQQRFPHEVVEPDTGREVHREMRIGRVEDDVPPPPSPRPPRRAPGDNGPDDGWEDRSFLR
ncbi:YbaB/EbfC DNA-binding family protein [Saccharothrix saharensis]|uniref:YbaB/EbfC DNA-binding family protein n=1 Tax=Saccharothrix saharensis TaxID=571190 RepID=A0A543J956_9PSEU|nr:YbaB/EbfC family nucleoid-associated protein [Saccharothrix saharensis]TQM79351.1 YbaB/EbfC DNA-binding family protein [Saccharothrix saharensis]